MKKPERNTAETVAGDALLLRFGHRAPPPGLARRAARGEPAAGRMAEAAWRSAAACRSTDPDLFFPVSSADTAQRDTAEAQAVCARCPVQAHCREFALRTRQQYGIWGGMTEQERDQLWRRGER